MRMHRSILLAIPVLALFLAGCPAKPKDGECKTSEDCSAQEGYGKTCVEGRCQECGQDTDCKAGFVCRSLKCVPRPECERSDDCPAGKACQSGKCMTVAPPPAPPPECMNDAACPSGKACQAGKCVTSEPQACPAGGGKLLPVFFAFDRAVLTPESQTVLTKNAACIKEQGLHPDHRRGELRRPRHRRVQPPARPAPRRGRQEVPGEPGRPRQVDQDGELRQGAARLHGGHRELLAEEPPRRRRGAVDGP